MPKNSFASRHPETGVRFLGGRGHKVNEPPLSDRTIANIQKVLRLRRAKESHSASVLNEMIRDIIARETKNGGSTKSNSNPSAQVSKPKDGGRK